MTRYAIDLYVIVEAENAEEALALLIAFDPDIGTAQGGGMTGGEWFGDLTMFVIQKTYTLANVRLGDMLFGTYVDSPFLRYETAQFFHDDAGKEFIVTEKIENSGTCTGYTLLVRNSDGTLNVYELPAGEGFANTLTEAIEMEVG